MPLDPELTLDYMRGFLGYGNPKAKWWFIGAEEGGGSSVEEVEARITQWHERKQQLIEDLREFSNAVGHGLESWFCRCGRNGPPTQSTWRPLIRVMLTAKKVIDGDQSIDVTVDQIREFQLNHWGVGAKHDGQLFLSEVQPLPARGVGHWPYACSRLWKQENVPGWAASREKSQGACHLEREALLYQIFRAAGGFDEHRVIVIYAGGNLEASRWVLNTLGALREDGRNIFRIKNTLICLTRHATARAHAGYWTDLSREIGEAARQHRINLAA